MYGGDKQAVRRHPMLQDPTTILNGPLIQTICDAIRAGCYTSVACQRAGISKYAFYAWIKRGQREQETRAAALLRGEPAGPATVWEVFYEELEKAKAEARIGAETWVYANLPLHWLRYGYTRADWRESNRSVAEVVDELERRIAAQMDPATQGTPPQITPEQREEYSRRLRAALEKMLPPDDGG
jgi:hypothetical protein